MKFGKKLISLAAATALVAGVGLAAAAPASAVKNPKTGGMTTIKLDRGVASALAAQGISFNVINGGKASGPNLMFNVTGRTDGSISHSGTLQFLKNGTLALDASNPVIGWPTDQPLSTATITMSHPVLGELVVFNIKNFKEGKTKVSVNKKKKTRTATTIYTGIVHLTDNAGIVSAINGLLGTDLLQPDMRLGTISAKVVVSGKCANKACTR